ncbi:hypothetical protein [Bacillus sp. AK128]
MIELNLLFILLLLTTLARYLVFGVFELHIFATIFLFPVGALVIYIISKRMSRKELFYQPKDIPGWSFYNIQKSIMIRKPLFHGDIQRGYVKRYFPQKWQYAFADIFGFNWYLSLEIKIDQDQYDVRWYRKKWFTQQDQWFISRNGEKIGEAHTLINLKNTAKLKEAINYKIYNNTYMSSASTVTSTIALTEGDSSLGTLKRNHIISNIQVIDIKENKPEHLVALIIHSFYFKNK